MTKPTLVIGASENEARYSNIAMKMLQRYDHPVLAFGRRNGEVNGIQIETALPTGRDIDTITLYINPSFQEDLKEDLESLAPERIIFNPGTENPLWYSKLKRLGIEPIEACTLVMLRSGQY